MIIAGRGHAQTQHILIIVHRLDHRAEEQQELRVFVRRIARLQKVHTRIGADRPVVVLAAAVDAGKGLLMKQTDHVVLLGDGAHELHGELVMVSRNVGGGEDRCQLVLAGGDLVVLGLSHDTQLPEFFVQFFHERGDPGLDGAEIVVVQLLPLGRFGAEQRAPGIDQVLAFFVDIFVYEEVLLLRADRGLDRGHIVVAKELDDAHPLPVNGLHGAQQRRLFVQRIAAVGTECGRDAEDPIFDKGV